VLIESNKSLTGYNSFGFDIIAEHFAAVESVDALHEAIQWSKARSLPHLILGGGSNMVFTRNIDGLVIHMAMQGITKSTNNSAVTVNVCAGEEWHPLVKHLLEQGIYGLENLALIPGLAGAAPIQNIGAYGVEVCNALDSVVAYDTATGSEVTIPAADCDFSYRHSLFKTRAGKRYVITAINLILSTIDSPTLTYKALTDAIQQSNNNSPTAQKVFDAVCTIRREKLPDPSVIGNAGSFFKNPIIDRQLFDSLKNMHPELPSFEESSDRFKIPAAWLIDRAGWKGRRFDEVGVHSAQALVLVNHGGGNGQQIAILANNIKQDILQRYGVLLEREPTLY